MLTTDNIKKTEKVEVNVEEAVEYHWIIQTDKYKILIGFQKKPTEKYIFKDEEIGLEQLIAILENAEKS